MIRGNSAILKCVTPSFLGDFITVLSWHTDQGEEFLPNENYGIHNKKRTKKKKMNYIKAIFKSMWADCLANHNQHIIQPRIPAMQTIFRDIFFNFFEWVLRET